MRRHEQGAGREDCREHPEDHRQHHDALSLLLATVTPSGRLHSTNSQADHRHFHNFLLLRKFFYYCLSARFCFRTFISPLSADLCFVLIDTKYVDMTRRDEQKHELDGNDGWGIFSKARAAAHSEFPLLFLNWYRRPYSPYLLPPSLVHLIHPHFPFPMISSRTPNLLSLIESFYNRLRLDSYSRDLFGASSKTL